MICPRCSAEAPDQSTECPSCGIIFAKWRPPRAAPSGPDVMEPEAYASLTSPPANQRPWPRKDPPPPLPPEYLGITHAGWKAAAMGGALALVLSYFPFLSFILSPLSTLVHELGHTAMYWLFGYSAIPAFDFGEGGGVTMTDGVRSPLIVAAWVCGLLALAWRKKDRPFVLGALVTVAIVYFVMYNGLGEEMAVALGGHGGEVVFGTLFLYRALTGWGCQVEAERPLYAFLAFKILFASIGLGVSLLTDYEARYWYLQGKRGIDNDLLTGAQLLGWKLESVARGLVALSVLAIPLAFWAASVRKTIGAVSDAEEEP